VTHLCVSGDVTHLCVSGDVTHLCVSGDVTHLCVSGDVTNECVSGDVYIDRHISIGLYRWTDSARTGRHEPFVCVWECHE